MKSHKFKTKMSKLWILITVFCSFVLTIAYPTYAFFRANTERQVEPTLEIEVLFGRLREDLVSGEWGTEYNPYLIMTTEHLSNLSVLQNGAYSNYINENSVFQVSDENGDPIYVGGTSANQLFDMQSIGTKTFHSYQNLEASLRRILINIFKIYQQAKSRIRVLLGIFE